MSLRKPAALITPLSLAAVGALSILSPVAAQDATPTTTQAGVIGDADTTIDCSDTATPTPATAETYTIVSDQSEARYVAEEELASQGAKTAIGKTNAFI